MNDFSKKKSGFTLVEMVVAVGIFAFLGMAMVTFQITVLRNTASMQSGLIAQQQARKALSVFTKEVRTAIKSPSGTPAIVEASTSTLCFYSNIDSDPLVERVKYYVGTTTAISKKTFYKQVIKPVGVSYPLANAVVTILAQNIAPTTTPIFTYYDSSYAGTSSPLVLPLTPDLVRHIKMALPIDPNSRRSPVFQTYSTQVTLRNLKSNL